MIAYVCNGSTIDAWFSGPASSDGKVTLTGKDNATLTAAYGAGQMTGDVTAHGTDFDFWVDTVSKSSGAGLYRATAKVGGDTVKAGWIVLDDGTQIGSLEPDSTSASAVGGQRAAARPGHPYRDLQGHRPARRPGEQRHRQRILRRRP